MGKVKKYNWVIGEEFPLVDDHSIVKLEIIERYIEIYLTVLTQSHVMDSLKLTVVDGFAGGGLYSGDIKGSPLRIYESIQKTQKLINYERENKNYKQINFDIDLHLIEKCKNAYTFLEHTMKQYGYSHNLYMYNGKFEDQLDALIQKIQKKSRVHRSIFVLDQYGYTDASIGSIKKIFKKLKKVEVILTFSVDSLIDYISRKNPKILTNMGLSKEDCERIFDVKEDNDFARSKIQPILYQTIINQTGASFYTPFFIKSDTSNRSYWLFHLSSHSKARDEMMKLHWDKQNTFQHFGKAGLKMLIGYDSSNKNSLFEAYGFDHGAKEKSLDALSEELPALIHAHENISFDLLKNTIINETPATVDMIKQSLNVHIQTGEIIVKSADGATRQKSNTIKDTDFIIKPKKIQKRMFM